MKRKASRFLICRVTLALLTLVMAFAGAQTAWATTAEAPREAGEVSAGCMGPGSGTANNN